MMRAPASPELSRALTRMSPAASSEARALLRMYAQFLPIICRAWSRPSTTNSCSVLNVMLIIVVSSSDTSTATVRTACSTPTNTLTPLAGHDRW